VFCLAGSIDEHHQAAVLFRNSAIPTLTDILSRPYGSSRLFAQLPGESFVLPAFHLPAGFPESIKNSSPPYLAKIMDNSLLTYNRQFSNFLLS
jgi:hypothetical protein